LANLESDYWSQYGHLKCAQALQLTQCTPDAVRARWPDLARPLDNDVAFGVLLVDGVTRLPELRPSLDQLLLEAQNAFIRSLVRQPKWVPAQKNLSLVTDVKSRCLQSALANNAPKDRP
jgi:hypothetical protein